MTQVLRFHQQGDNKSAEFVALAGMVGITGNSIIGEVNTYGKPSQAARYILGRASMMTVFDQSVRRQKLPMRTCVELAINLSKAYFHDLVTGTKGAFMSRASTALSYLIIAGRIIFDHVPSPEEQDNLPTP